MTRYVFDTAQVAHVWAQGRQDSGRNSASRVFFEGAKLFSYGQHFLTGYRLPDGAAFLNSARYSVSTSRHCQDARRAVTGRGYAMPGPLMGQGRGRGYTSAFPLPDFMDSRVFAVDSGLDQYPRVRRPATPAELKAARPALLKLFLDCEETAPAESIVVAFTYAGAKPEEAAKAAAKVLAAHAKRAKEEAARQVKQKAAGAANDARNAGALPLSAFADQVGKAREQVAAHNWRGAAEREAKGLLESATRLFKARKEAKAKGWTRLCADLKARESILRAGAKGLESFSGLIACRRFWKEGKDAIRAGLVCLPFQDITLPGEKGPAEVWTGRVHAARSLARDCQDAAADSGHWLARRAKVAGADLARMAAGLESILAAFEGRQGRAMAGADRAKRRGQVAALRAFLKAPALASSETARKAAGVAGQYALIKSLVSFGGHAPKIPGAFALAGFTGESFAAIKAAALARLTEAEKEEAAAKIEAWREGGPTPGRTQDTEGGALIRATGVKRDDSGAVTGGRLSTSWGADVPLPEAIRAFRFLKLCRDKGKAWAANGHILEVGAFRVDWIDAAGNFKAGCHRINWPEVAALAARLGLSDLAPADTTQERESALA